jgi:hypothetical protein
MCVSLTFCPSWPRTAVLLISDSQVARIIGISYHAQQRMQFLPKFPVVLVILAERGVMSSVVAKTLIRNHLAFSYLTSCHRESLRCMSLCLAQRVVRLGMVRVSFAPSRQNEQPSCPRPRPEILDSDWQDHQGTGAACSKVSGCQAPAQSLRTGPENLPTPPFLFLFPHFSSSSISPPLFLLLLLAFSFFN